MIPDTVKYHIISHKGLKIGATIIVLIICMGATWQGISDRIIFRMETESLHGGKKTSVTADIYYQAADGKMITHYIVPSGQFMITNDKGELQVYNRNDNTLFRVRDEQYGTRNTLLYHFLSGAYQDMGLRGMGFSRTSTRFEHGLVISFWNPPANLQGVLQGIELVHEAGLPVYAAYYNVDKRIIRKVYYTEYQYFDLLALPMSVIEFNYLPGGDSLVSRINIKDVYTGRQAGSRWQDFEIPSNARIIH